MKKFLKISALILASILVIGLVVAFTLSEHRPKGVESDKAEMLTDKMWEALGKSAYDSTRYFSWNFADRHTWYWDKEMNVARGVWGDVDIRFNLDDLSQNMVILDGKQLSGKEAMKLTEEARDYFYNDSFWLLAPFKARDAGTSRKVVIENGKDALLVEYNSGGATPGDAYLWHLGENGTPENFQMWVSIIPIGGMKADWSNWEDFSCGIKFSTIRDLGIVDLKITDIQCGNSPESIGLDSNELQLPENQ